MPGSAGLRGSDEITFKKVLIRKVAILRIEKFLHRLFVAFGDVLVELVSSGAEAGSAEQVRHKGDVCVFTCGCSHGMPHQGQRAPG